MMDFQPLPFIARRPRPGSVDPVAGDRCEHCGERLVEGTVEHHPTLALNPGAVLVVCEGCGWHLFTKGIGRPQ
jgi:hypothetical protein